MSYTKEKECANKSGVLGYECKYECSECGDNVDPQVILAVDHIDGNPNNNSKDNLWTLCHNCHAYKTNLNEDWLTPGRNKKSVEGSNYPEPIDFIHKPWVHRLNEIKVNPKWGLNNIQLLVGLMGQGKTHTITKYIIPKIANHIKLLIVSAPELSILDRGDFYDAALENGYRQTDSTTQALQWIRLGKSVVLTTTHGGLLGRFGQQLIDHCSNKDIEHMIVIDEAHTWLCTDPEVYKLVVGWSTAEYAAALYNLLSRVSQYNPYIFALTATPNGEQDGRVSIDGGKTTFEILNKLCPIRMMMWKQAWLKEHTFIDLDDVDGTYETIQSRIEELYDDSIKTGIKKTLMINCSTTTKKGSPYQVDAILSLVKEIYTDMGLGTEYRIAEMRSGINYIHKGNGSVDTEGSEETIKYQLNDSNDPLSVLLVVNKGRMGMNVHTLGGMINLKSSDKNNGNGQSLTETARQTMGRLVRPNVGCDKEVLSSKFNYDLSKYYESLDSEGREVMMVSNSFFVDVPDNPMWRQAVEEFKTSYVNTLDDVKDNLEMSK